MQRKASAIWKGNLREGAGIVNTESGVLRDTPYSFTTRFENSRGTNPEELIAAAHAACFSMALSAQLMTMHLTAEKIETSADLTFEKLEPGWTITKIHLDVAARVPGRFCGLRSPQPQHPPKRTARFRAFSRPKSA